MHTVIAAKSGGHVVNFMAQQADGTLWLQMSDGSLGQEAIATGFAIDLRREDTLVLASHQSIASLVKGVALSDLAALLYERHNPAGCPTDHILYAASSLPSDKGKLFQAAGNVALANKRENKGNVVVVFSSVAATAALIAFSFLVLTITRSTIAAISVTSSCLR